MWTTGMKKKGEMRVDETHRSETEKDKFSYATIFM